MATYTQDQITLYLQHIGFPRAIHPTDSLQLLTKLQRHHLARVPFDSIALHYSPHRLLSLDPEDLYQKIVVNSRGGYCMEVNTLFAAVLRSLGFTVYSAGARVKHERWDHMVNLVTIAGKKYLVDVGFGAREPTEPVPLVHGDGYEFTNIAPRKSRLRHEQLPRRSSSPRDNGDDDPAQRMWVYSARRNDASEWEAMYSFTEMEFFPEDFEVMNYFVMTRPQSYFVQTVLAYLPVMDVLGTGEGKLVGEHILHGDVVKLGEAQGDRVVEVLRSEKDRARALEKYFSICLTEKERKSIQGLMSEIKK